MSDHSINMSEDALVALNLGIPTPFNLLLTIFVYGYWNLVTVLRGDPELFLGLGLLRFFPRH